MCLRFAWDAASFRRECHITKLECDGFTNKQAVHGVDLVAGEADGRSRGASGSLLNA